jgi:FeS assembly protein IscX
LTDPLYWDGAYALAYRLKLAHPEVDLETVTLRMIEQWVIELPEFADDPALVNDDLLTAIYQEWYEEVNRL